MFISDQCDLFKDMFANHQIKHEEERWQISKFLPQERLSCWGPDDEPGADAHLVSFDDCIARAPRGNDIHYIVWKKDGGSCWYVTGKCMKQRVDGYHQLLQK